MHSGGFTFASSTSGSGSIPYQAPLGFFTPPRFNNRLREFPLDLRYRPVLTPPSTPSPPRKRTKFLNLDLKTFEVEDVPQIVPKLFNRMNQFSSTISIDDKKYFQNSVESFLPNSSRNLNEVSENADEFIDITGSDNETDNFRPETARKDDNELFHSDSNLTDDLSNQAHSETSDEIVDIESNEDSVVFSELMSTQNSDLVLENGKTFFDDPQLHSKAIEGFAKLFDASLNQNSEVGIKKVSNHRSKKRIKSRKQMVDEETTSPVSGTIIRKLHEGEELVVRKGDIDPVSAIVEYLKLKFLKASVKIFEISAKNFQTI